MSTDTVFKGKTCPRCKNNHTNDGVLCSFCANESQRRLDKVQPIPVNYWVECMIQREGDTVVALGGVQYRFRRNEHGHSVCEIINPGHYKQFTGRMGSFYRAYDPDKDYPTEIRQETERLKTEKQQPEKQEGVQQDDGQRKEPLLLLEADKNQPKPQRAPGKEIKDNRHDRARSDHTAGDAET